MEKTFDPAAVEARIAAAWEAGQCFRAGRPERRDAAPYCIVIPPPNVTGSLHMGHALNNTLQDILCRFERMRGKDVLWQPGTDHAGIATQMVVERKLAAENRTDRRTMGREAFLKEVWAWKAESGGTIVNQLKRLGASCDWSRERFTMDEGLSRAVLEFFVRLHEAGLIYKDKRLVNWDPKLLTAISNLEVEQVELAGHLWHFRYPVEGETYDPDNPATFITVATTRPETMLGDTAVAVHPDDARFRDLLGRNVVLPIVGRRIPVIADEYSDPEKGSGAVKITPAHDFNDFEVGRRHRLPVVNVLTVEGALNLAGNEDFLAGADATPMRHALWEQLHGLDRFEARKRIVKMMEEGGFLAKVEPHRHAVPHGDRSAVPIEPFLTEQWYVDVKPLAERAMAAVKDGRTRIIPAQFERTYFHWMETIEPWCISRQLWWGHQIPAWYGPDGDYVVARDDADAKAKARAKWGGDVKLTRDPDVLDTWFSSGLWPFSTLGWPDRTPELARYYPNAALVTGFDILFFWVARMMMSGLFTQDEVPFADVIIHGLIRDERGRKMSKTIGNVIDPLTVIDKYGADALRFALAASAVPGRDIKLAMSRIEGYRNFATKIWNAARFAEMNGCERVEGFDPASTKLALNRWVIGECGRAVAEVTAGIEAYRFDDAAAAAYRFVWNIFCDWFVELAKPVLLGEDSAEKAETRAATAHVLDEIARMLHPFMPFLTEELWRIKGEAGPPRQTMLALAAWPAAGGLDSAAAEAEIGFVVDLISEIRSVRAEIRVPAGTRVPLVLVGADEAVARTAATWRPMIERLAMVADLRFEAAPPPKSAQVVVRGTVAALPLEGVVDLDQEVARLRKEIDKLVAEIAKYDAKLGNADFLARAPEEVVEEQRERREQAVARLTKAREALARLGG